MKELFIRPLLVVQVIDEQVSLVMATVIIGGVLVYVKLLATIFLWIGVDYPAWD